MAEASTDDCKTFLDERSRALSWPGGGAWKRVRKAKGPNGWERVFERGDGRQETVVEPFGAGAAGLFLSSQPASIAPQASANPAKTAATLPSMQNAAILGEAAHKTSAAASDNEPFSAAKPNALSAHTLAAPGPAGHAELFAEDPLASRAWQTWYESAFSIRRGSYIAHEPSTIRAAAASLPALSCERALVSPIVEDGGLDDSRKVPVLEAIMLVCGFMNFENDPRHGTARGALIDMGRAAISRGALPSNSALIAACEGGNSGGDMDGRLSAALEMFGGKLPADWRAAPVMAACARHGGWAQDAGLRAWELLQSWAAATGSPCFPDDAPACEHPFANALASGGNQLVDRLAKAGAGLGWRDPSTGATLWHFASAIDQSVGRKAIEALAKSPEGRALARAPLTAPLAISWADDSPRASAPAGSTALHISCRDIFPRAFEAALAGGADPNALDSNGDAPLSILARRWGSRASAKAEPMVRALLAAGADPSIPDAKGRLPAAAMAAKGPLGALAELLEARPQDIATNASALEKLSARGAEGLAQAERASMRSESADDSSSSPRPPKAKTRSL